MSKVIDLSKSVYEICSKNPEVIQIMKEIGFDKIMLPGMLNTAGRFMTIPKGAESMKISLDQVRDVFHNRGYEIRG